MARNVRWVDEEGTQWVQPIATSLDGKPLRKVVGREFIVVGCTRIDIPSTSHPLVPYYVLLLADEHGARMPKKVMREYELGVPYVDEPDPDAVATVRVKYDVEEAVAEALELIGGLPKAGSIAIVPRMQGPSHLGRSANPLVIRALLSLLEGRVVTLIGNASEKARRQAGLDGVEFEEGLPEVDLVISVPVIDTEKGIRCAREHAVDHDNLITLADGTVGSNGGPAHYHLLLAARDAGKLDEALEDIFGIREHEVKTVGCELRSLRRPR